MVGPLESPSMVDIANEVIARARRGDEAACRDILATFEKPIFQTVFRLVGGRYPSEIEDLTQEIFLKIFRALDRFEPERGVKFSTWIYTFVKNHCFDALKRKRVPTVPMDGRRHADDEEYSLEPPGQSLEPAVALAGDELSRRVAAAVEKLPPDQRITFVLREYQDLDYQEIAAICGCSEGTVKSRLHRAKEALRHHLRTYVREHAPTLAMRTDDSNAES